MDFTRKLSFLVFMLCVLISLKNQNAETNKKSLFQSAGKSVSDSSLVRIDTFATRKIQEHRVVIETLKYDYYNESCPLAEQIIRSSVQELQELRHNVAPALLRLVFHDCFVEGCDASILLDPADDIESEKDSPPNESLKGFDLIDIIKSDIEAACPGIVSCADIVALAARESVLLAGGPFYPVLTGRKDSTMSFLDIATSELPSPQDDLSKTIEAFGSRGFNEREIVSLLGAHSTGTIHCKFFSDRLYNFSGTNRPDPSIDTNFLNILRSICNNNQSISSSKLSSTSSSSTASPHNESSALNDGPGMQMDYEGPGTGFGTLYYRSLLRGKGLLFVDQQLTVGEETATWVRAYAADTSLFQGDFGHAMIKLSNFRVLTAPMGQVRLNCRKVN
ncbi:putative Peroxidase 48 [Andrographis paniculata]|uniref:putative Peroxidase 48 n=1 Tax=Andrographis paniculata TaxID=175694 RepID=UPI0021E723AE|nr:putative Peroxidase 48 [Andrographis paniculata]